MNHPKTGQRQAWRTLHREWICNPASRHSVSAERLSQPPRRAGIYKIADPPPGGTACAVQEDYFDYQVTLQPSA